MKFGKKFLMSAAIIAVLFCMFMSACDSNSNRGNGNSADNTVNELVSHRQQLNYNESTAVINNPDQGFYIPISVNVTESGAVFGENAITDSTQLYHLRIDISAFSNATSGNGDKELTKAALDGIENVLKYLRERDKNAIVRFAYDPKYGGSANKEPSLQTMLKHIEQICPIINRYENTVTALEAGLIGPWGEMHTSAVATSYNITEIIKAYLNGTNSVPLLVRTPKMIYDYLGITVNDISGYAIDESSEAYRLGIYNDGYLGSETDLGTYTDRQKEIEFLSTQTAHLPYGGEVVIPSSNLHDIDKCLPEMFELNLSYLNEQWNNFVINKWKSAYYTNECGNDELYYDETAFNYIKNHFGYRFVLKDSVFEYAERIDELQIGLTLNNAGFGNSNRTKLAKIIFADMNGNIVAEQSVTPFTGDENYECSLNVNLPNGDYDVYLRIYGEEFDGTPLYCLRFANDGLWNAALKANKIGSLKITELFD